MRLISASLLAAALSVGAAQAADLPMVTKAPARIVAQTWTGCYVGVHAGYGWGRKKWADALGEFDAHDVDGALVGGQIGCDYQTGAWVTGLEGQGSWADIKGSGNSVRNALQQENDRVDALASITARLGYAMGPHLLYVKGGLAGAHDRYDISAPLLGLGIIAAADQYRLGWTVGAGWEYMFAPGWSAKLEYMYMDFGNRDVTFLSIAGTPVLGEIDQNIHTVKVGLNYRFTGWPGR
jgi:outer membrane immunogenic protein